MPYPTNGGTIKIANGVTSVDCEKQVRSWRLLRYLIQLLIPTCVHRTLTEQQQQKHHETNHKNNYFHLNPNPSSTTITGTIFGYRKGKVSFCIQTKTNNPILLLLELAVPTTVLAKEMQGGALRIALKHSCSDTAPLTNEPLLSTPVWTMHCNGRRVGYAIKRSPTKSDTEALRRISSAGVGAGVISSGGGKCNKKEILYLRASFKRVCRTSESESFHLIDPDGNIGQELSIFFSGQIITRTSSLL